jgi:nucleoside phosphorylase
MRQNGLKPPCAVILTAIRVEYVAVRAHLTDLEEETHPEGTVYERGIFSAYGRSWEVGIVEIGAGNAEAAVETKRAIDHFKPSVALFVGVADGIKDVALGDVVVATKVYGYESGKVVEETFLPRPNVSLVSYALEQRAKAEARKPDWLQRIKEPMPTPEPSAFVGAIAAGDKVVASTNSDVYRLLRLNYGDALAVEKESHGFLKAVRANKKMDALIIRGISALIDGKSDADARGSQQTAARHASAFAFEVLAKLGGDAEVTVEPGSITKDLDDIPVTNSNHSFIVDRINYEALSSGRRVYSFDVFNKGYADGVVEVRNARNELIEFRGIEGIRNATSIFGFGIQSIEKLWRLATEGYEFIDPRNVLGNSQKTEIRNLVVPCGGTLNITKKGDNALIYNQATFLVRLFFDSEFSLEDSTLVKARLLSAFCTKLQQEHIGSLVKDGALRTPIDALQALITGSWINKNNLDKLTKIGVQALAEQGLRGISSLVINEQVLGRSLGFWVTAAEVFTKGATVFLQWLDWERSQRAEEQRVTLLINTPKR